MSFVDLELGAGFGFLSVMESEDSGTSEKIVKPSEMDFTGFSYFFSFCRADSFSFDFSFSFESFVEEEEGTGTTISPPFLCFANGSLSNTSCSEGLLRAERAVE